MCRSAVNDGSCSPWVMCSCSVVRGNQIHDRREGRTQNYYSTYGVKHNCLHVLQRDNCG